MPPPIVLASASPRRQELLGALGVPFRVEPYPGQEPPPTGDQHHHGPMQYAEVLARLKVMSGPDDAVVIGADTVVWQDRKILGKPQDKEHAVRMLRQLRGEKHIVFTGLCVRHGERVISGYTSTNVYFGDVSDEFIERYVATGEPMDKAGAYGAQGKGALLIERIEGDYWNVVGLPLRLLTHYLKEFGVDVDAFWATGAG